LASSGMATPGRMLECASSSYRTSTATSRRSARLSRQSRAWTRSCASATALTTGRPRTKWFHGSDITQARAVRGNHDNAVAFDEGCRSAPLFRRLSVESRKKTVPLLSADNLTFLRSLPARKSVLVDGRRVELLHAAPGDPLFQYLPATRVEEWRSAAAEIDADLVLVGHTHLPVILDLGEKRVVNPGSVGLPRDGDPRACYATIDRGSPVLRRVGYDVARTIAALRAWGLPEDVTRSLESLYRGGNPVSPFTPA